MRDERKDRGDFKHFRFPLNFPRNEVFLREGLTRRYECFKERINIKCKMNNAERGTKNNKL